jgi:hypothetical protein
MWKEKVVLNINSKEGILSCKKCPPVFGGYKNLLYIEVSVILRDIISNLTVSPFLNIYQCSIEGK